MVIQLLDWIGCGKWKKQGARNEF